MKVNKKAAKQKWVELDTDKDTKFLIQPFPLSRGHYIPTDDSSIYLHMKERFIYCIIDWKGIVDEEDKPLKCNDENKDFIFEYVSQISSFIINKVSEFDKDIVIEKKI